MMAEGQQFVRWLEAKRVVLLGLGVSNRALLPWLLGHGAEVVAYESRNELPVKMHSGALGGADLHFGVPIPKAPKGDLIIRSPGIRADALQVFSVTEAGLFLRFCPVPVIGVSGSDGKTTTATLTARMLEESDRRVFLGENIGVPLLPLAETMKPGDLAVAELSSFQLADVQNAPSRAVLTNITPNHLNWHRDMTEYIEAKKRIFAKTGCRHLTANGDSALTRRLALASGLPITLFSSSAGCYADVYRAGEEGTNRSAVYQRGQVLYYATEKEEIPIFSASAIALPGRHNLENVMAAIGAVWGYCAPEDMRRAVEGFHGVAHRLETVAVKGGVTYINSSIDTTPTRTAAALSALEKKAILICGGYDKHLSYAPLAEAIRRDAKFVILTGATAQKIAAAITQAEVPVRFRICPDFEEAVRTASRLSTPGDIVLLSPACASFDAFSNFEERGRRFREIVKTLPVESDEG